MSEKKRKEEKKRRYGSNLRPVIVEASIQNYHLELRLSKQKFTTIHFDIFLAHFGFQL